MLNLSASFVQTSEDRLAINTSILTTLSS